MSRVYLLLSISLLLTACAMMQSATEMRHQQILDYCVSEIERHSGPLSAEIDQAYLYETANQYWINFTRGSAGTFTQRSPKYAVIMSCGAVKGEGIDIVYIGRPFQDAIIDFTTPDQFKSTPRTVEVLFERDDQNFRYCCRQPFVGRITPEID